MSATREYLREWRAAHPDYMTKWRQTPAGRESARRAYEKGKEAGKRRARAAIYHAVKTGQIERLPCADCGSGPTEAHHHNGYDRAHRFDVVWLCRVHHIAAHFGEAP